MAGEERFAALVETMVRHGDPGHGRLMREWLAVRSKSDDAWLSLATESEAFVARRRPQS